MNFFRTGECVRYLNVFLISQIFKRLSPGVLANFISGFNQGPFLVFVHVNRQSQTGATFLKCTFKVELHSCFVLN